LFLQTLFFFLSNRLESSSLFLWEVWKICFVIKEARGIWNFSGSAVYNKDKQAVSSTDKTNRKVIMDEKKDVFAQKLDSDELEAVTGGERDYAKEGGATSVDNSESCIFNDRCDVLITKYVHPRWTEYCPHCGQKTFAEMTSNRNPSLDEIYCINCGYRTTNGEYWIHH
jgi:hypothetical protein